MDDLERTRGRIGDVLSLLLAFVCVVVIISSFSSLFAATGGCEGAGDLGSHGA